MQKKQLSEKMTKLQWGLARDRHAVLAGRVLISGWGLRCPCIRTQLSRPLPSESRASAAPYLYIPFKNVASFVPTFLFARYTLCYFNNFVFERRPPQHLGRPCTGASSLCWACKGCRGSGVAGLPRCPRCPQKWVCLPWAARTTVISPPETFAPLSWAVTSSWPHRHLGLLEWHWSEGLFNFLSPFFFFIFFSLYPPTFSVCLIPLWIKEPLL